jgi:hypothetical protein
VTAASAVPKFTLPRLSPRLSASIYGFHSERTAKLGSYSPGERPTIFDPSWSRPRNESAVIVHEQQHQMLAVSTHFGVLTAVVGETIGPAEAPRTFTACLEEQWSVQEIAAVVSELSYLALLAPDDFEAGVSNLPSSLAGNPPYRELLEAAWAVAPFAPDTPYGESRAARDVIIALAAFSMHSDCLLRLGKEPFEDDRWAEYVRSASPHLRFEQAVNAVRIEGMRQLAAKVAEFRNRVSLDWGFDGGITAMLIREIHAHTPDLPFQPYDTLRKQAASFRKMMEKRAPSKPPQMISP